MDLALMMNERKRRKKENQRCEHIFDILLVRCGFHIIQRVQDKVIIKTHKKVLDEKETTLYEKKEEE